MHHADSQHPARAWAGIWRRLPVLALFALLAAFPYLGLAPFYTELAAKVLLLGLFAMSLDLLVGHTGLVSLGHAAYFGVAAYGAVLLGPKDAAANLWLLLPACALLAGAAAALVGLFALRTRGIYFIMVTLAFAQMAFYLFHDTALGGGSDGLYLNVKPSTSLLGWQVFDLDEPRQLYHLIVLLLALAWLALALTRRSKFGAALAGIRVNEARMRSLGYDTYRYKLAAFTLAGALAGVAGFLYAVLFGFVTPEYLAWHESGNALLMVILGGMGRAAGPLLGAVAFTGLKELFSDWTRHWQLFMGLTIVAAVLFLPGGLAAIPSRLQSAWAGWRARQHGATSASATEREHD